MAEIRIVSPGKTWISLSGVQEKYISTISSARFIQKFRGLKSKYTSLVDSMWEILTTTFTGHKMFVNMSILSQPAADQEITGNWG